MRRINKANPGAVVLGSQIHQPLRETITTGSLNLDAALGGGWATNHWAELIGFESSGKTFLALKTIAANQKLNPKFMTLWVATEDFHEPYAQMWGVDLDRVLVYNEILMETILEHVLKFLETKAVDLIVIDSLPGLVPEREDENSMDAWQPGLKAVLTGKFFRKSNKSIKRSLTDVNERPCTGLVINQWRSQIGVTRGDPRTTPGGWEKNFWFFQRVDIRRTEWLKNTKQLPIGQTIKVTNVKNKYSAPRRSGEVDMYFADGAGFKAGEIDTVKDVISAAVAYDVISKDGAKYRFGEEQWHGRPKLEAALKAEPKLRGRIKRATLNAATNPLPAPVQAHTVKRAPTRRRARATG